MEGNPIILRTLLLSYRHQDIPILRALILSENRHLFSVRVVCQYVSTIHRTTSSVIVTDINRRGDRPELGMLIYGTRSSSILHQDVGFYKIVLDHCQIRSLRLCLGQAFLAQSCVYLANGEPPSVLRQQDMFMQLIDGLQSVDGYVLGIWSGGSCSEIRIRGQSSRQSDAQNAMSRLLRSVYYLGHHRITVLRWEFWPHGWELLSFSGEPCQRTIIDSNWIELSA